jgi:hypothetical protein
MLTETLTMAGHVALAGDARLGVVPCPSEAIRLRPMAHVVAASPAAAYQLSGHAGTWFVGTAVKPASFGVTTNDPTARWPEDRSP